MVFKVILQFSISTAMGEVSKALREWDTQKSRPFNRQATSQMEHYRTKGNDAMYETTMYKWGTDTEQTETFKKYNPTSSVPQAELDACAHKFLIDEANEAQNALALNPDEERTLEDFERFQSKLRDWRGGYVFKRATDCKAQHQIEGCIELSKNFTRGPPVYEVSFCIIEKTTESRKPKKPIVTYIRFGDNDMDTIRPSEIIDIVELANKEIKDTEIRHMNEKFNKGKIENMVSEIKGIFYKNKDNASSDNNTYFQSLDSDADVIFHDTAHFAFKSRAEDKFFRFDNHTHSYRFNINRIVPGKSKIYHNPKVVQKMENDTLNAPFPAMCVEFTVNYSNVIRQTNGKSIDDNHEIVWTISKTCKDNHMVTHLSYISKTDKGFYELPDTLQEIINNNTTKIDTNLCGISKYIVPTQHYNKHNYTELLNLHSELTHFNMKKAYFQNGVSVSDSNLNKSGMEKSYAFIYEYKSGYTVIASTILHPFSDHNCTSYTIIHWNNSPYKLWKKDETVVTPKPEHPKPTTNIAESREKELIKGDIETLKRQVLMLRVGVEDVVHTEDYGTVVKHSHDIDFFVPGILKRNGDKFDFEEESLTGLIISKPTIEQRLVLENRRRQTEGELMRKFIGPYYENQGNGNKSIRNLLVETFDMDEDEERFIKIYPGYFGHLINIIYEQRETHYEDDDYNEMIDAIKSRAEDWYEFLKYTSDIHFKEGTKEEFEKLKVEIENKNRLIYEINRMNRNHPQVYSRHTAPWAIPEGAHQEPPKSFDHARHNGAMQTTNPPQQLIDPAAEARRAREHNKFWDERRRAHQHDRMAAQKQGIQNNKSPNSFHGHGERYANISVPGNVSIVQSRKRDKSKDVLHKDGPKKVNSGVATRFHVHTPFTNRHLAATAPEFIPSQTLKMQTEIDSLKRILNELTLRAAQ